MPASGRILIFLCSALCTWSAVRCWTYNYSDNKMVWDDARAWCREHFTDMVAIQNQEEIQYLNTQLPKRENYYWIGIRKINEVWTWVGTKKALTAEASNWAENEPNNGKKELDSSKSEDCVEMYVKRTYQAGKWNDEWCGKKKTALCYSAACKKDSCLHGECVETINSHRCQCGPGFSGERCENVVKCDENEVIAPFRGRVNCSHKYGNFTYDSLCQYSCEEGFQLSTSGAQRCTETGSWSERPPTCDVVKCPPLPFPSRGFLSCTNPLGGSSFNSTCSFSCHEGYQLQGSESLRCLSTGNWNDSQPTCAVVQCPPLQHPENGSVSCEDESDMQFSYKKSCSFSCAPGFRLVGVSRVTCTSAAEWSESVPHCEAITCHSPGAGDHLIRDCSHAELGVNSTCSFSCEAGFDLQGVRSIQCDGDGRWSNATPVCKAVQCPPLQDPENGLVSYEEESDLKFSYKKSCSFSCEAGFDLQGAHSIQCAADGRWSDAAPVCKAVQCPPLQDPENGFISCKEESDLKFSYEKSCSFSCEAGFDLQGAHSIQCAADGRWSAATPVCKAVQCPPLKDPENGSVSCEEESDMKFSYEKSCSFSCEAGFDLQGAHSIQCAADGRWSEAIPSCQAVRCRPIQAPENGHMNCSASEPVFTSQCVFTCKTDFSLHGHELLICGHHGNWTGEKPTCEAAPMSKKAVIITGVAAGTTALASGLSLIMWILKRLKGKVSKFELSSNSDIEVPPQHYKNSIDSLI